MTRDVANRPSAATPAARSPQSIPLFQQVMGGLARSAEDWEAPVARVRGALSGLMPVIKAGGALHSPLQGTRDAERWTDLAPPLAHWLRLESEAQGISQETPDRNATMLLVGMMLDAFPNSGREPRDGYYATVVHEIIADGYGPSVVATACREVRRASRFLPTVSEMLEACDIARTAVRRGTDTIALALTRSREAAALTAQPAYAAGTVLTDNENKESAQ